jgi:spore coat protein CotH
VERDQEAQPENGDDVNPLREGYAWYLNYAAAQHLANGYDPGLAAWVRLYVNGDYLGVYVNVEQPDKTFLKNRGLYTKDESWLYKAGDVAGYELKVGDPDSLTTTALCYAPFAAGSGGGSKGKGKKNQDDSGGDPNCTVPDSDEAMAAELNSLINMQAMLTLGAVSAFHMGPDDLFSKGKNFYYIDFLAGDKRLYTQWDLDSVFVGETADGSIYGQKQKGKKRGGSELSQTAYQEVILNNPTFRAQYDVIMNDLLSGPLSIAAQTDFLNNLEAVLTSAFEEDPNNNFSDSVPAQFENLRERVSLRVTNINEQLGN